MQTEVSSQVHAFKNTGKGEVKNKEKMKETNEEQGNRR